MILRRFMKHVSDQNWFAVGLDVLVVITGIFLGMQVTEWNEERQMNERAAALGERLADDFGIDAWSASSFLEYYKVVLESASLVLDDVTDRKTVTDEELLIAAYRASQFTRQLDNPTYKELISSGGFALIATTELGRVATAFYETSLIDETQIEGQSSAYRHLYRSVVPIEVQLHTSRVCGDRTLTAEDLMRGKSGLSYDCDLTLPEDLLSEAAATIRAHPKLADMLRHRIATLSMQLVDLESLVQRIEPFRADAEALARSIAGDGLAGVLR